MKNEAPEALDRTWKLIKRELTSDELDDILTIRKALEQQVVDVDALHSKLDMDMEDRLGREIDMNESRHNGLIITILHEQGHLRTPTAQKESE